MDPNKNVLEVHIGESYIKSMTSKGGKMGFQLSTVDHVLKLLIYLIFDQILIFILIDSLLLIYFQYYYIEQMRLKNTSRT